MIALQGMVDVSRQTNPVNLVLLEYYSILIYYELKSLGGHGLQKLVQ